MFKLIRVTLGCLLLVLANQSMADPGKPNFMPAVYGDGEVWGTKGTTSLPAPKGANTKSFDKLYVISNANDPDIAQLPVSEAAPGNPQYNGGRWDLQLASWNQDAMDAYDPLPVLMSAEQVHYYLDMGYLEVESGETYFQCPLLPVKY
mgnify:CR=1 FL=1